MFLTPSVTMYFGLKDTFEQLVLGEYNPRVSSIGR